MQDEKKKEGLNIPENAFRELKPGEQYVPVMRPDKVYPEVTPYSVTMGLLMAVIFSAAAAYLGLKVGQVFEAAIPIAIIAVGLSGAMRRKNALGENVIIQSIGASSGIVVAGAIFTLPALYILQATYGDAITVSFLEIFLSSLLGGVLGILLFIPFRKYFCSDMHGKFPFPEATATTQVLISGEKAGNQAKPLIVAGLVGGIYDFLLSTFGWWSETLSTKATALGAEIAEQTKMLFKINTGAAVLGLGFIVGLKYSFIIFAGSAFIWYVIVPLLGMSQPDVAAETLFSGQARYIGIGGIAMSGIIGIIKSWGIIRGAVGLAGRELKGKGGAATNVVRTQKDMSMKVLTFALIAALVVTFVFFYFGVIHNLFQTIVAFIVVTVIAFLFTTVAANAIAIVGTNPVSGMTLMTLIIASAIFVAIGLNGASGIVASMIIGGVVCTALSMAGGMVTDMKIGYWLGSTPQKQQSWKLVGTFVSAATVGGVILILAKVYGFSGPDALAAPQANAMAAVIEPLMMGGNTPWMLYGVGAILAVLLNWLGVPALAFSLGMFIPLELNAPLLVGGLISWFVSNRSKDKELNSARQERGTLLASGFIAGGALMGVVSAGMRFAGFEYSHSIDETTLQITGVVMYLLLIGYLTWDSLRAKKQG
jgi:oligopeptide transporter, OPT family